MFIHMYKSMLIKNVLRSKLPLGDMFTGNFGFVHFTFLYHLNQRSQTFLAPGPILWKTIFPETRIGGEVLG